MPITEVLDFYDKYIEYVKSNDNVDPDYPGYTWNFDDEDKDTKGSNSKSKSDKQ